MQGDKEKILRSTGLNDLAMVAKEIIDFAKTEKNWLFIGEMGAGKTTLIKNICQALGVIDQVSSPTFAIVNEYETDRDDLVYHFDFYRLKAIEEAIDIGVEDYFFSGHINLIEWPQLIVPLLPDQFITIHIEELRSGERKIILKHHG